MLENLKNGLISNLIFMVFNWILIDKLAIGTPVTSKKEKVLLKEKGIKTILDLRNSNDFNVIDYQKHIENLSKTQQLNKTVLNLAKQRLCRALIIYIYIYICYLLPDVSLKCYEEGRAPAAIHMA